MSSVLTEKMRNINQTQLVNTLRGAIMPLDIRFGKVSAPIRQGATHAERRLSPLSRTNKNNNHSIALLASASNLSSKCPLSALLFSQIYMIWLVDSEGNLLIALEEGFPISEEFKRYPMARNSTLHPAHDRLGHPSLVGGAAARIGGEIYLDTGFNPPCLVMSNASGRYGINCGREPQQLENVANLLRNENINIITQFV